MPAGGVPGPGKHGAGISRAALPAFPVLSAGHRPSNSVGMSDNTQETLNAVVPLSRSRPPVVGQRRRLGQLPGPMADRRTGKLHRSGRAPMRKSRARTCSLTGSIVYRKALTAPASGQQNDGGRCGPTGARIPPEFLARSGRLPENHLRQGHMGVSHAAHDDAGPRLEKSR